MKIVAIIGGSIAAYKACDVVSKLIQSGHEVTCVLTSGGAKFVGAATLEGLSGKKVLGDLFESGEALEHIRLNRWADVTLVCPASANLLNRFAAGLGEDLAGAMFLAREPQKPWLLAPAMNPQMWAHPATRASVLKLREWGVKFVDPELGRTACDEIGEGRLAEPATIVTAVEQIRARASGRGLKVLVTSGGTTESIDAVRVLTNISTGSTGAGIAQYFAERGHEVTLLRARSALRAERARDLTFYSFSDLAKEMERLLRDEVFDLVIHAAAVSDFTVDSIEVDGWLVAPGGNKLDSTEPPTLRLRPTPKLVDAIHTWSRNPDLLLVAFKLTAGRDPEEARQAARSLLEHSHADLVVLNDIAQRKTAVDFPAEGIAADGETIFRCHSREELPGQLESFAISYAALP